MPKAQAVTDEVRQLLRSRLEEIEEERRGLERALAELGGKARARRPGRPRGRKTKSGRVAGRPKGRRKRPGDGRADQAVALIEKSPGANAGELSKQMKIAPNYVYRVLGDLTKEKRVRKEGREYFPAS
jgi:hypothetical protein